jgi:hypothetical protein
VRKIKESQYVLQEEADVEATGLVTREMTNKKAADDSILQQVMHIASEIDVPVESLLKESTAEDAQKVVELAKDVKDLVTEEAGGMLKATVEDKREEGTSEAVTSEATRGKSPSQIISDNIIDLNTSPPSSSSDKTPIPSPANQSYKPDDVGTSEPLSIDDRLGALVDQRLGL